MLVGPHTTRSRSAASRLARAAGARSYSSEASSLDVELLGFLSQCSWGPTPTRSRSAASRLARAAGARSYSSEASSLDVELLGFLRSVHDEPETRRCILTHELVNDAVGDDVIVDLDL